MSWPSGASGFNAGVSLLVLILCALSIGQDDAFAGSAVFLIQAGAIPSSVQVDTAAEAELVDLINESRQQNGQAPLTVDPRLTEAARKHSQLMAAKQTLSHRFPEEPTIPNRFAAENFPSDRQGENVALDQDAAEAHRGLMHSPPHRENILDPQYNVVGVGVIRSGRDIFVTEDFARRVPEMSEPQAEAHVQNAINQYARARGLPAPVRKPQPQLRRMACDMALNDTLNAQAGAQLPQIRAVFAWTAADPAMLPKAMDQLLSEGLPSGYSLGACFAPSVSHPGGIYWLVFVSH